jgi:MHS family alpha-ketoglutarate permease-like MFS transporter
VKGRLRSIAGGSLGNLVEWYDWYVYSAFSLYFAKNFFPGSDPTAQLLSTSGIFALGFLMRPFGGVLFGLVGDRHGRRTALTVSIAMMCAGSLIIVLVPGYATIGIAAPLLLTLARMLQGVSLGGEYGTAATYLAEISEPERRGFWSSFQYVTLIMGQLTALGLLLVLQYAAIGEAALESWGWRIPFAVGALLAVTVFWLRRGIEETPDFLNEDRSQRERASLKGLLRHRREALLVFGMSIGSNVAFYAFTTYMQKYLVVSAGFAKGAASTICTAAIFIYMLLQPLGGALSDRIGRKPLLWFFAIAGTLLTVPLFTAIGSARTPLVAFLLVLASLIIVTGATSTSAAVKAELFPPHIRALGVGVPYALSQALFGGTAEYVALWLKNAGHESVFFYYVAACVAVAGFAYLFVPESAPRRLRASSGSSAKSV